METALAFLGSTTLGTLISNYINNPVHIFDIDSVLIDNLRNHSSGDAQYFHYDANSELDSQFKGKYNFLFVDPPWSSTLLKVFLLRSVYFLKQGGTLAISFPPKFTRPGIEDEREDLFSVARQIGLNLEEILNDFTEYSVPPFEKKAYDQHGVSLNEPWRTGDLVIFKKVITNDRYSNLLADIKVEPKWTQFCFGTSRVFLKRDGKFEEGCPNIEPISGLDGFICNSTSSRLSFWKEASIVSTRNCIAHATGRKNLSDYLDFIINSRFERNDITLSKDTLEIVESFIIFLLYPEEEKPCGEILWRKTKGRIRRTGNCITR